jgi:hypothetical protein
MLHPPGTAPAAADRPVATERPKWTPARALLVMLMDRYRMEDYRLSYLEVQKLAYFLQAAGEPLRLRFQADRYGPYADNLVFVLQRMEGHFIRGAGERSPRAEITVLPDAVAEAREIIAGNDEALARLDHVQHLIQGFETPYGMELLATTHWVCSHAEPDAFGAESAVTGVQQWSHDKQRRLQPEHIRAAWRRLLDGGWLVSDAHLAEDAAPMAVA